MRSNTGCTSLVAGDFDEILEERGIQKRKALSDITKSILAVKSINTIEITHVLPREGISNESKQGYIFGFLSHSSIDHKRTMKDVAP